MNLNILMDKLIQAISKDKDIRSWSEETYARTHKVFVNVDRKSPPKDKDCPYIAIYPIHKTVGQNMDKKEHGIEIICCVHDDSIRTQSEDNIIEYNGVHRVETFRKKVETAIAGVPFADGYIEAVYSEYDTIESYPFVLAGMMIVISEPVVVGSDPLE